MSELKLKRGTSQHIEDELYAYHDTQKRILRLKNELLSEKTPDENVGGGRSSRISDPTARTAILLVSHRELEQLETIADAIQDVYDRLPIEKQRLIKIRYWTKPQTLNWIGIAEKLHVSHRQAMRWRDEIVLAIAVKLGWR